MILDLGVRNFSVLETFLPCLPSASGSLPSVPFPVSCYPLPCDFLQHLLPISELPRGNPLTAWSPPTQSVALPAYHPCELAELCHLISFFWRLFVWAHTVPPVLFYCLFSNCHAGEGFLKNTMKAVKEKRVDLAT